MTSHRIGVNLRVSGNCDQGGRKYMEDYHAIKFVKKDDRDYEFAYFGIFDGHGGPEASRFARDNLLTEITKYDQFWSEDDEEIKFAIRSGFLDTHQAMWKELDNWPLTVSGLPSTSGTTASIAIVKKGKLYIGHVGDSGIVLGCDEGPRNAIFMKPLCLTKDHKPDNPEEKERIEKCGGAVVAKAGVQRVVWSRPKVNHKGPIRRSTQIDKIPFLAVARSLGDLWSYDYYKGQFVVSPDPDVSVMTLEPGRHRSLVLGSDGLWNMLSASEAVSVVTDLEMHFEDRVIHDPMVSVSYWINPAEKLVSRALNKWRAKLMKADNISCIVVLIDPLGPSKLTLLRKRREEHLAKLQDAKAVAANATCTKKIATVTALSSSGSSISFQSPTTSSAVTKANHNQNNLGDRENRGGHCSGNESCRETYKSSHKSASDDDTENKAQDAERESATAGRSLNSHSHSSCSTSGIGCTSFVGRDITLTTNQATVNNSRGGHILRSSTHSPPAPPHTAIKAASTSKAGSVGRAFYHREQHLPAGSNLRPPFLPRRMLGHSGLYPGDLMDDSVQATSSLASLSPADLSKPLSSTHKDTPFLGPSLPGGLNTTTLNHLSPVSMSSSLLQLMSLDAVKAQSNPLPQSHASLPASSELGQGKSSSVRGIERARDVRDQQRHRRSAQNSGLQRQQQHGSIPYSSLITSLSGPSDKSTLAVNKTFHSGRSFKLNTTSFTHFTRSLDKTFHSTRLDTSHQHASNMISPDEPHRQQPPAPSLASPTSSNRVKDRHSDSSKALRALSVHSSGRKISGKKDKKRRHFGLLSRTLSTLHRARKALCPENKTFLKQLSGSKRKWAEKHAALGTSATKRLRRSDGQHS